ncbi:MAG: hypothetical protein IPJ00_11120 [Saprospirales bacterium]|nr:hypothetical protein [Saprospirales bacterium]
MHRAGGRGRYFPADNAEELSDALEQTVEKPILNGGYLSVKVTLEGKPVDATVKAYKKARQGKPPSAEHTPMPKPTPVYCFCRKGLMM